MASTDKALVLRIEHTIAFLRMAAIEMRRLAELSSWTPGDAAQLCHIADQCDQDADALSKSVADTDSAA